jgi:RNA recognition motif-containing protein
VASAKNGFFFGLRQEVCRFVSLFFTGVWLMNIYVGNLPWSVSEEDVREAFSQYGSVTSVKLINDQYTGKPRGFGFVEMDSEGGAKAIDALDGTDFGGRNIKVNEAKPRPERQPRRW